MLRKNHVDHNGHIGKNIPKHRKVEASARVNHHLDILQRLLNFRWMLPENSIEFFHLLHDRIQIRHAVAL